jgi:hypothetical protein
MTSQVKMLGPLVQNFLNIMIGVENRVMIVLNIMKGIKTGSKYYVFNIGVENRVKIFGEKTKDNLGMKTWIPFFWAQVLVMIKVKGLALFQEQKKPIVIYTLLLKITAFFLIFSLMSS